MRLASLLLTVVSLSLVSFACTSGGHSMGTGGAAGMGGAAGRGGDGGDGGNECRGPFEDYCSPCATYAQAFADAFEGFEICSGDGPTSTLPAAGTCGEFRWIVTWDVIDEYFEYFDASGTMVGATFVTDYNALCDFSSFSKDYGLVPDCERVITAKACETWQTDLYIPCYDNGRNDCWYTAPNPPWCDAPWECEWYSEPTDVCGLATVELCGRESLDMGEVVAFEDVCIELSPDEYEVLEVEVPSEGTKYRIGVTVGAPYPQEGPPGHWWRALRLTYVEMDECP